MSRKNRTFIRIAEPEEPLTQAPLQAPKGRGAIGNIAHRFHQQQRSAEDDG